MFGGVAAMIAAPSHSGQIELVTGEFTNDKGIGIIKFTNDKSKQIENRVTVLNCSSYQAVPSNEWRTNINPKQKDDDQFVLSSGNSRYFSIQFKNPGCYQICLIPLNTQFYGSACYPIIFN